MIEQLIGLLVYALILGLAAWFAYWIIGHLPAPFQTPALVIVSAIFLIIVMLAVAGHFGGGKPLRLWP